MVGTIIFVVAKIWLFMVS